MRPFAFALLALAAVTLPAVAQSSAIPYSPPTAPPPPDLLGVVLRLLGLTLLTLVICGGLFWLLRRAKWL